MNKKSLILLTVILTLSVMLAGCTTNQGDDQGGTSTATDFPKTNINGIIQWGAGGGTDNILRPLATLTEKNLDVSIVMQNKPGGVGAVATQYVHDLKADGYNLLMGAENPALYKALELSDLSYDDFETVLLVGSEAVILITNPNSDLNSVTDLVNAANENPGELKMATTGRGGSQWQAASILRTLTGAEFNQVPFDGDADCLSAVLGGHADFTTIKISQAVEPHEAGTIKVLATFTTEPLEALKGTTPIVDQYPDFEKYTPFGPFYGVFAKNGTPQDVLDYLQDAFKKGFESEQYQQILENLNVTPLGIVGEEATQYVSDWQRVTATSLYIAGEIDKTLEELDIE